jgi:hypothetical protein
MFQHYNRLKLRSYMRRKALQHHVYGAWSIDAHRKDSRKDNFMLHATKSQSFSVLSCCQAVLFKGFIQGRSQSVTFDSRPLSTIISSHISPSCRSARQQTTGRPIYYNNIHGSFLVSSRSNQPQTTNLPCSLLFHIHNRSQENFCITKMNGIN